MRALRAASRTISSECEEAPQETVASLADNSSIVKATIRKRSGADVWLRTAGRLLDASGGLERDYFRAQAERVEMVAPPLGHADPFIPIGAAVIGGSDAVILAVR